jgi:hypothetical protein
MNGLSGLNKSPQGVVVGLVQLQLPVVETVEQLSAPAKAIPLWIWWFSRSMHCTDCL